jgi:hypothetical protein
VASASGSTGEYRPDNSRECSGIRFWAWCVVGTSVGDLLCWLFTRTLVNTLVIYRGFITARYGAPTSLLTELRLVEASGPSRKCERGCIVYCVELRGVMG